VSSTAAALIAPLEEVLSYQNPDVVARFAVDYGVAVAQAEEIFTELKRWLWLCAERKRELEAGADFFVVPLFNEAYAIDLMWHTFLLFTEDYAAFCARYFGFFVHHRPRPESEREAWLAKVAADPEGARAERRASLRRVYEYLYERLGPAILKKWCEEFPRRFPLS
jgi:hypothetical protein